MEVKKPTTYAEQIGKLQQRGCKISDECKCGDVLRKVNYYRLTAYFLPFKQSDDTYINDTNFERVYQIYEFDRRLRIVLFSVLEEIEIKFRASFPYYHAHKYGALGYMEASNYNLRHNHLRFTTKFENEIFQNGNVLFVKHYIDNYDGNFPIWVAVEIFTFGMLSCFYADLKRSDQREIANKDFSVDLDVLRSWIKCCNDLRNICAHYGRLYYRRFRTVPKTPAGHFTLGDRVFDFIIVLKHLYPSRDKWNNAVLPAIEALVSEYAQDIELQHIGFPENWLELLTRT